MTPRSHFHRIAPNHFDDGRAESRAVTLSPAVSHHSQYGSVTSQNVEVNHIKAISRNVPVNSFWGAIIAKNSKTVTVTTNLGATLSHGCGQLQIIDISRCDKMTDAVVSALGLTMTALSR